MLAAIQLRGTIDARQEVKDTLRMLNMTRKHACVLIEDNPSLVGMLRKSKDFATYGPVSDELAKELKKLMGEKKHVNLHPPRGGFKSIKRPVNAGGDLGARKEMDPLIRRMLP